MEGVKLKKKNFDRRSINYSYLIIVNKFKFYKKIR